MSLPQRDCPDYSVQGTVLPTPAIHALSHYPLFFVTFNDLISMSVLSTKMKGGMGQGWGAEGLGVAPGGQQQRCARC